ncbi:MAG TPA: YfiR/HmsC family protein, partial [Bacteroidales bacterium]|nr:YfiR/HmsC family protein [Bacteroidales bacterium]
MLRNKVILAAAVMCLLSFIAVGQSIDDNTRATLILDIAKYVEFDESFDQLSDLSITILDTDDDFYWSVEQMATERKFIQGKPVRVYLVPRVNMLNDAQIIYLNEADGFNIKEVLKQIEGENTLLITEGYPFRESMINFVVVDGKPRFEANEELMNEHGLYVDELFLAHAIKTREDWEQLYEVTDEELQEEKEVTRQQKIVIAKQDSMIQAQINRLKELAEKIMLKEKELEEKVLRLFNTEEQLTEKNSELAEMELEMRHQRDMIAQQEKEMQQQKSVLQQQESEISQKETLISERDNQIKANEERIAIQLEAIQKQKIVIGAAVVALFLLLGLAYFIYVNYRNKKKANKLLEEKNEKITAQRDEIEKQKDIAEMQRDQIAYQKKHITDSIHYAQRIQRAILPSLELFSDEIDHFVLYKPRDIVSGDFYWVDKVDNKQIIIAADCTGHGVPGAFMSMLGVSLLNEIILNRGITNPADILNNLRSMIIESLNQEHAASEVKDGMDMTVTLIDFDRNMLYYSGANNPLYHIRDGELTQYKADKMPVAIHERMEAFNMVEIALEKGDTFYTFSDGYVDQFGGPKQKKFLAKNFRRVLLDVQNLDMIDQGAKLDQIFEEYRSEVEQVDDVVVIGIKY